MLDIHHKSKLGWLVLMINVKGKIEAKFCTLFSKEAGNASILQASQAIMIVIIDKTGAIPI